MTYRPDPVTSYVVERFGILNWHRDSPYFDTYQEAKDYYDNQTMDVSKDLDNFRICVIVKEEVEYLPKRK